MLSAAPSVLGDRKGVFTSCERAEFLFRRAFAAILGEACGLFAVKMITKALFTAAPCKVPTQFPGRAGSLLGTRDHTKRNARNLGKLS